MHPEPVRRAPQVIQEKIRPSHPRIELLGPASVHFSSTTTGGDDNDGEDNNNNNNNSDSEDNNNDNGDDDVGTTIDTTQESMIGVASRGFEPLNTLKILKTASKKSGTRRLEI